MKEASSETRPRKTLLGIYFHLFWIVLSYLKPFRLANGMAQRNCDQSNDESKELNDLVEQQWIEEISIVCTYWTWSESCLHFEWTTLWKGDSVSAFDKVQDLSIGKTLIGKTSKGHYLIQQDSIAPDIRCCGEDTIRQRFRSHPANWKHSCGKNGTHLLKSHKLTEVL